MSIGSARTDSKDIMRTSPDIPTSLAASLYDYEAWLRPMTLKKATRFCSDARPDQVLGAVLDLQGNLPSRAEHFQLLGAVWPRADTVWRQATHLHSVLTKATEEHLLCMMTSEEQLFREGLPDEFDVYRGCYHHNIQGLTWSLVRDLAMEYPYMQGNRMEAPPLLVSARLRRRQSVVKIGRDGVTVIGWKPISPRVEMLEPASY